MKDGVSSDRLGFEKKREKEKCLFFFDRHYWQSSQAAVDLSPSVAVILVTVAGTGAVSAPVCDVLLFKARSTCPRSRAGSTILRTSDFSCLTSSILLVRQASSPCSEGRLQSGSAYRETRHEVCDPTGVSPVWRDDRPTHGRWPR